ncbi:MAG: type II secretion system GspH family protein [bacterium]|nr:type II secretion system GspH family protein [bacterium]
MKLITYFNTKFNTKLSTKRAQGFTLVETLVAVSILVIAILPPLLIAYQGAGSVVQTRNQMVANYLAQDAMDFIIAKKNENILKCEANSRDLCRTNGAGQGQNWLADLGDCFVNPRDGTTACEINTTNPAGPYSTRCRPTCSMLRFDPVTARYKYGGTAPESIFRRIVVFSDIPNMTRHEAVSVRVTVQWMSPGKSTPNSFNLKTNLYHVKP